MKSLDFTFYTLFFLPIFFLKTMEKEIEIFQPKSLQELCVTPFYSDTLQDKKKTNNNTDADLFSTEALNNLNKKLPLRLYPSIAYHVLKAKKITTHNKYAIICFLRDYPDEPDKKSKKIIDFFAHFIDSTNFYCSHLLPVALTNTVKPCVFNYLLQSGEKPDNRTVWHLIGNEKSYPNIHNYMIKKLAFLLKQKPPLEPKNQNSEIMPLEYAQNMLKCLSDKNLISSFKEEEIKTYKNFYTKVVDLLLMHSQRVE